MTSELATLQALEGLLNEFFDPVTSNERKRNIENLLSNFGQQTGAWKLCFIFLEKSKNEYVHMYALSVLENLINLGWFGIPVREKQEIRASLFQYLVAKHKQIPSYIRNKAVKAIADVGRNDWPHEYPDYFSMLLQLIKDSSTVGLGVLALQITSEEFISPREDLNMSRRNELRELLINQSGTILQLLSDILEGILLKHKRIVNTETPPPSPNHGGSPYHSSSGQPSANHSPFASPNHSPHRSPSPCPGNTVRAQETFYNLSPYLSVSLSTRGDGRQPMDSSSEEIVISVMTCLTHLFSWMPLSNLITGNLISKLFCFAEYGALNSIGNSEETNSTEVGIQAMNAINEVMSKNLVPAEFEGVLLKLFQQAVGLLYQITKNCSHSSGEGLLSRLNGSYVEKFTEFLYLFVSIQMKRFEPNPNFHTADLLGLLLKYTFIQEELEGFYACLDIWIVFLDYLATKLENSSQVYQEKQTVLERYGSILMELATYLLQKIQFKFNAKELDDIDFEKLDDDVAYFIKIQQNVATYIEFKEKMALNQGSAMFYKPRSNFTEGHNKDDDVSTFKSETDWDKFLTMVFEAISKLLELMPEKTFQKQKVMLDSNFDLLIGVSSRINAYSNGWNHLSLADQNEGETIHYSLKDLSTSLRGIGTASFVFIGEQRFKEFFHEGQLIMDRISQVAMFGMYYKTYSIKVEAGKFITKDFVEVQSEALGAIKAFSHWLCQYNLASSQNEASKEKFTSTVMSVLEAAIPALLIDQMPTKVLLASSQLLVSIATTVRPSFFLAVGAVQKLYEAVGSGQLSHLSDEVEVLICRALSNSLVLPWHSIPDSQQEWEMRSTNHRQLLNAICKNFNADVLLRSFSQNDQERRKAIILRVCRIVSDVIEAVSGETTQSKRIVYQSTDECLRTALDAFPVYIAFPDVTDSILNLLLVGMQSLKVRMGLGFVQEIIQRLLDILTRDQLMKIVGENNHFGCKVVEKFLKILELVVQEPNTSFKKLASSVITFGLEHILPVLNKCMSSELKVELFNLFHELLTHNWRYFYKADVLSKMSGVDMLENEHQFVSIIKEFGRALMENDIELFKKSLAVLEDLNEKYKLYHKAIFRDNMMPTFLQVLLHAQVNKSHNLLEDEITLAVHHMVSVDFDFFFTRFIPEYLLQAEGVSDQQKAELLQGLKMEKDFPSFSAGMQRFASDLRYYRMINRSLPPGSVQL